MKEMKKRQGDILFVKIDKIKEGLVKKSDNVIAEGEAIGHKHMLMNGVLYLDEKGDIFAKVENDEAIVVHEEHKQIALPRGDYRIIKQREYLPESPRPVAD
ncbi:MAG: hypothetical protein AABY84_12980 [Candidatus Firestonebacteria bacterium]